MRRGSMEVATFLMVIVETRKLWNWGREFWNKCKERHHKSIPVRGLGLG